MAAGTSKEPSEEAMEISLGIASKDFDPMRVIYGPCVGNTNKSIEVYENVSQFMQHVTLGNLTAPIPSSSILAPDPELSVDPTKDSVVCENNKDPDPLTQTPGSVDGDPTEMTGKPPSQRVNHPVPSSRVQPCEIDQSPSSVNAQHKPEADDGQGRKESGYERISPANENENDQQLNRTQHTRSKLPELTRTKRRPPRSTVLTKLENDFRHGPLSILRRSVHEKIKVRVWTRSVRNIRGISTGYVVAFDKHMNLAMMDVDEVYRKPVGKHQKKTKKTKDEVSAPMESSQVSREEEVQYPNAPWQPTDTRSASDTRGPLADETAGYLDDCENNDRQEVRDPADGIGNLSSAFSGMHVFEENEGARLLGIKSRKVLARHLNQVFLRGEHVVAVSLVEPISLHEAS